MRSQISFREGHYYHIYNKGVNGCNIFIEKDNYRFFLQKYSYYCYPVIDTYTFCLLRNHFHFFIRIRPKQEQQELFEYLKKNYQSADYFILKKDAGLLKPSKQLANLFNSYAQAFNRNYGRKGNLFIKPLQRELVDHESYFQRLVCYIHQNPLHHKSLSDFRKYPYSSYSTYLSKKFTHINRGETLQWFGGLDNFISAHDELEQDLVDKLTFER